MTQPVVAGNVPRRGKNLQVRLKVPPGASIAAGVQHIIKIQGITLALIKCPDCAMDVSDAARRHH
jgi:hypothetical protein